MERSTEGGGVSDDDFKLNEFWQAFEHLAYAIDGEPSNEVLGRLTAFAAFVHSFRDEHPEFFVVKGPHFDFAMYAAANLILRLDENLVKALDARIVGAPEGSA
jgi:hypothetical protein